MIEKAQYPFDQHHLYNKLNEVIDEVNALREEVDGHTHYTEFEETTERTHVNPSEKETDKFTDAFATGEIVRYDDVRIVALEPDGEDKE